MKLRKRLTIAAGVCLALGGWAISTVALQSSARGYTEIEHDRALSDVGRIHEAFQNAIHVLHTKSADWANWDDTYDFVATQNPDYVESNLNVGSLMDIKVDLIAILSPESTILQATAVPLENGAVVSTEEIRNQLISGNLLRPDGTQAGYLVIEGKPVLVSVRPVLPSKAEGAPRGWIIFARRLDSRLRLELQRLTRHPVHFRTVALTNQGQLAEQTGLVVHDSHQQVKALDATELKGTSVVHDMLQQPLLQLETLFPRQITAFGKVVGQKTVAQVLGIATLLVVVMMAIIERFILWRLRWLHRQVAAVDSATTGTRIQLDGADELTSLANQVNTMLEHIEAGSCALRASEERLRAQNENLETIVAERTAELRASEELLRHQKENLEVIVAERTREVEHQALHDKLTGLPNRTLFLDRLGRSLAQSRRDREMTAVLFVDLDNFKLINDSLGHDQGDQLLIHVGQRIEECIRGGDTVARLGGDEFTVILTSIASVAQAEEVAERILMALRRPIFLNSSEVFTGASIGVALCPDGSCSAHDLLKHADVAMYRAKNAGKSSFVVFDERMNEHVMERLELEMALRKALEQGDLDVAFQPIIDLRTGEISGVEALARWTHPERGPISPAQFIPIAEDTGLIVPLGNWVLERACQHAAIWNQERPQAPLVLNVNVSGRQLKREDVVEVVAQTLKSTGLEPSRLKLELTESILLDDGEDVALKLQGLKKLGVALALDDFGTGYSSLSTLRMFPIDTLKVDRSFISILEEEEGANAIVEAIAAMARTLGLDVTAEGVESREQAQMLSQMGVSHAQGFHYGRPMPACELTEFLRSSSRMAA